MELMSVAKIQVFLFFLGWLNASTSSSKNTTCNVKDCIGCPDSTSKICNKCKDGTYLENNTCINCDSTCETCSDFSTCLSCDDTRYLSSLGFCNLRGNLEGKTTYVCDSFCLQCDTYDPSYCYNCLPGYELDDYICDKSNSTKLNYTTTKVEVENCEIALATSNDTCAKCEANYYLEDNECTLISDENTSTNCIPQSHCKTCLSTNSVFCFSCVSGYYLAGSMCVTQDLSEISYSCDSGIQRCLSCHKAKNETCTSCLPEYYMKLYPGSNEFYCRPNILDAIEAAFTVRIALIVGIPALSIIISVIVILCIRKKQAEELAKKVAEMEAVQMQEISQANQQNEGLGSSNLNNDAPNPPNQQYPQSYIIQMESDENFVDKVDKENNKEKETTEKLKLKDNLNNKK